MASEAALASLLDFPTYSSEQPREELTVSAFDQSPRPQKIADPRTLGPVERYASLTVGALLLLVSRPAHPLRALVTAAAGSYLVYRGASGRCPLMGSLTECCSMPGDSHLPHMQHDEPSMRPNDPYASYAYNGVDEAVAESFPASDPPSYSGGSASPSEHL